MGNNEWTNHKGNRKKKAITRENKSTLSLGKSTDLENQANYSSRVARSALKVWHEARSGRSKRKGNSDANQREDAGEA